jgi:hypothetical protein
MEILESHVVCEVAGVSRADLIGAHTVCKDDKPSDWFPIHLQFHPDLGLGVGGSSFITSLPYRTRARCTLSRSSTPGCKALD